MILEDGCGFGEGARGRGNSIGPRGALRPPLIHRLAGLPREATAAATPPAAAEPRKLVKDTDGYGSACNTSSRGFRRERA